MNSALRNDGRTHDQLRPMSFELNIAKHALGSVLVSFGNTRVICAASIEKKVPQWMLRQGETGGWITAEYSMLPYCTLGERKQRDITRGKPDGRTIEIQRLIGRAIRAVVDLEKLSGHTLWIDCDVLQADGGTRTASITGAYVAAQLAVRSLMKQNQLAQNPFRDSIAAISVGLYRNAALLDLNYEEDKDAAVDANVVMTGNGRFVELQCSGEESSYTPQDLSALIQLATNGISQITALQQKTLQPYL